MITGPGPEHRDSSRALHLRVNLTGLVATCDNGSSLPLICTCSDSQPCDVSSLWMDFQFTILPSLTRPGANPETVSQPDDDRVVLSSFPFHILELPPSY
jgi:hypothetical protein